MRLSHRLVALTFVALVAANGARCTDDECSSPRDCASGEACVSGQCVGKADGGPVIRRDRPVPETGPLPDVDGGDMDAETGPGPELPGSDTGDGGGPVADPDVFGEVFVRQFAQTQALTISEAGGRIEDRENADIVETTTDLQVAVGRCELVEIAVNVPGVGVQIEGVDFTIEETTVQSFTMDSSFTGDLEEPPSLPDRIFTGTQLQRVTFDLRAGFGMGRPEDVADLAVPGPGPFMVTNPIPTATLVTAGGVDFSFSPALQAGQVLFLRLVDESGRKQLRCEASSLTGLSYFVSAATMRAYFALNPENPILDIGLRQTVTAEPGVQGGGDARITFEVFRGSRYTDIAPPP